MNNEEIIEAKSKEIRRLHGVCREYRQEIEKLNKRFPNDFESWHETHFEVVSHLVTTLNNCNSMSKKMNEEQGTGGLYELAKSLTNEFEIIHADHEWDGEFYDEIEKFLWKKENE